MEEYPTLTRFCYTAEELHEEYGLSLEGALPKDLTEENLPNDQWLKSAGFSTTRCIRPLHLVGRSLPSLRAALLLRDAMRQQRTLQATKSHGRGLEKVF